jgi:hypothetical protein
LSFLGARRTGAGAVSVVSVAVATGFLTGVALVAVDVTALVGVAVVFLAVVAAPWATLDTLAINSG